MLFAPRNTVDRDHADSLWTEFEEVVADLADRAAHRHQVVKDRLAALEHEDSGLTELRGKLA